MLSIRSEYLVSLRSSMLNKRPVYHNRGLAYVRIQAVGVTNCRIKKGATTCRIKKMVEHTKKRGNAENKTAFYYIRYRQANVSRISALICCLEIVIASKSPVQRFFQIFLCQTTTTTTTTDGQNRLLNPARACAARGNKALATTLLAW